MAIPYEAIVLTRLFLTPCASKDRGDYNAEAVESERQCKDEQYALLIAEIATALPSTAIAKTSTSIFLFIAALPRSIPRAAVAQTKGVILILSVRRLTHRVVSACEKFWRQ
jgi:hypothetical protein